MIEEVGSTTRTFITSMKDHPAVLVLALCNLALIVFMYFALSAAAGFRTELIKQSFDFQSKAADLLARCVLQPNTRGDLDLGYKLQGEESKPYHLPPLRGQPQRLETVNGGEP